MEIMKCGREIFFITGLYKEPGTDLGTSEDLADKRPNRGDTIDRLSLESTEQVAKRSHLDADYSGSVEPNRTR